MTSEGEQETNPLERGREGGRVLSPRRPSLTVRTTGIPWNSRLARDTRRCTRVITDNSQSLSYYFFKEKSFKSV